jgi:gamma-glutamylcyclotransferase (GGCT)/AIG2-like uncharacterized protein YtfP
MYNELAVMVGRKLNDKDLKWRDEGSKSKDTKVTIDPIKSNIISCPSKPVEDKNEDKAKTEDESSLTFMPREGKNFVILYGSLRPDMVAGEEDLENLVSVQGLDLYDTTRGYPAAIEVGKEVDEDIKQEAHVYGLVCEIDNNTLEDIDTIESAPSYYTRKLMRFETVYGDTGEGFIYTLSRDRMDFAKSSYIAEGSWLSYISTIKDDVYRADCFETAEWFLSSLKLDEDQIFFNLGKSGDEL